MKGYSPDETGLELLLDTVCNTFGAVMFITMLLAVITSMAARSADVRPPDDQAHQKLVERGKDLEAKRDRLRQLGEAVADNQAVMNRFANEASQSLAASTNQAATELTRSLQSKEAALSAIVQFQQNANSIAEQLQQQREALRRAQEDAAAAEAELKAEQIKRSKSARLPQLRESTKEEVVFFLKYGRLYSVINPNQRARVNTSDCTETELDGVRYIDPRPTAGLPIIADEPDDEQISQKVGSIDGRQFHAVIVVWPDSFPQFQPVKDALVKMRVEYDARVMPKLDDRIFWGHSTGPSYVQ